MFGVRIDEKLSPNQTIINYRHNFFWSTVNMFGLSLSLFVCICFTDYLFDIFNISYHRLNNSSTEGHFKGQTYAVYGAIDANNCQNQMYFCSTNK